MNAQLNPFQRVFFSDLEAMETLNRFNIDVPFVYIENKGRLTFPSKIDSLLARNLIPGLISRHSDDFLKLGTFACSDETIIKQLTTKLDLNLGQMVGLLKKWGKITIISARGCLFLALCNPNPNFNQLRKYFGVDQGITYKKLFLLINTVVPFENTSIEHSTENKEYLGQENTVTGTKVKLEIVRTVKRNECFVDASVVAQSNLTVLAVYHPELQECVIQKHELVMSAIEAEKHAIALAARAYPDIKTIFSDCKDAVNFWMLSQKLTLSPGERDLELRNDSMVLSLPRRDIVVKYVPREQNGIADKLANQLGRSDANQGRWKLKLSGSNISRTEGFIQLIPETIDRPKTTEEISFSATSKKLSREIDLLTEQINDAQLKVLELEELREELRADLESIEKANEIQKRFLRKDKAS